jgi:peptide/nickel transport system permease protein
MSPGGGSPRETVRDGRGPDEEGTVAHQNRASSAGRSGRSSLWRRVLRTGRGRIGLLGLAVVLTVVVIGPLVSPHPATQIVGLPFASPSSTALLGTDYLGRDLLSRILDGGRDFLLVTVLSTLLAIVLGGTVGLVVGLRRGAVDLASIWFVDVLLSIPAMVFALAILSALGSGTVPMIITLSIVLLPGCVRILRTATLEASTNEYVEVALSRNESLLGVAVREVAPNIATSVVADLGVRIAWAAILASSLSFLGLGHAPPAPDWGRMVSENRGGLLIAPLSVLVPAAAIAIFTISVTCIADSIAQSTGKAMLNG